MYTCDNNLIRQFTINISLILFVSSQVAVKQILFPFVVFLVIVSEKLC